MIILLYVDFECKNCKNVACELKIICTNLLEFGLYINKCFLEHSPDKSPLKSEIKLVF